MLAEWTLSGSGGGGGDGGGVYLYASLISGVPHRLGLPLGRPDDLHLAPTELLRSRILAKCFCRHLRSWALQGLKLLLGWSPSSLSAVRPRQGEVSVYKGQDSRLPICILLLGESQPGAGRTRGAEGSGGRKNEGSTLVSSMLPGSSRRIFLLESLIFLHSTQSSPQMSHQLQPPKQQEGPWAAGRSEAKGAPFRMSPSIQLSLPSPFSVCSFFLSPFLLLSASGRASSGDPRAVSSADPLDIWQNQSFHK